MLYSAGVAPLVWGLRGDFSRVKVKYELARVPGIVVPENFGIHKPCRRNVQVVHDGSTIMCSVYTCMCTRTHMTYM